MDDESVLWEETIEPGATWSHVLKRGTSLRIVDLEGGANVGAIFYNFDCPAERYNMADTLKAQHIARLTEDASCTRIWAGYCVRLSRTRPDGTIPSAGAPMRCWCFRSTARLAIRSTGTIATER
jgi:hypothetical protein